MKITCLFIALIFVGCQDQLNSSQRLRLPLTYFDSLKMTIIGRWGPLGDDVPIWDIRKDSFYIFDRSTAYFYKLSNDSLIIDLDSSKHVLHNLIVDRDTLIFSDEPGTKIRFFRTRRKNK